MRFFLGMLTGIIASAFFVYTSPFYLDTSNFRRYEKEMRLNDKVLVLIGRNPDPNSHVINQTREITGPDVGYKFIMIKSYKDKDEYNQMIEKMREIGLGRPLTKE